MKNISKILSLLLALLLLSGCGSAQNGSSDNESSLEGSASGTAQGDDSPSSSEEGADVVINTEMFSDRDFEVGYDETESITVHLTGDSATASSESVIIDGSTVTITEDATHIISGSLDNGMIIVNAPDTAKLRLVLNGASITSESSAALYILEADKVFVTLADGSENTLANGGAFTAIDDSNIDAAVFSKQDLTFNGSGSLSVTSPAGHGIVCKDDLVLTSGTYTVSSASHGIDANDSVRVANADITVDAGKDGIHSENNDDTALGFFYASSGSINIEAEGDGISAAAYMLVDGGDFSVTSGGGSENGEKTSSDNWGGFMGGGPGGHGGMGSPFSSSSDDESSTGMKGLKCTGEIIIEDGVFDIDSADDSVHSNATVTVNGGTFDISGGDDAFHADDTLTVNDCNVNILTSYEGLEAEHIRINGGEVRLVSTDDGLNAAGGTDASGTEGGRDGMFGGGGMGGMGGGPGGMASASNGSIEISGGTLYINASGDGIDANGSLSITGGEVTVSGANNGDTAILDFDSEGVISAGTFIGTGASGMTQNFSSSSTQGVIMLKTGSKAAGTVIKLTDESGNAIITHTADQAFSCVILSHASIVKGGKYWLTVGSESTEISMTSTVYGSDHNSGGRPR